MALKIPDLSEEFNPEGANLLLLTSLSVPEGVSKKVTLANLRGYTLPLKSEIDALGVNAGTVGGNTVETPVPTGAVFTDTQLSKTDIEALEVDAGTVGGNTVETSVPTGAVFTDTQLSKTDIDALEVNAGTVGGKTVETSVPTGAVFTDTQDITSDLSVLPSGVTGSVISNIIRVDQADYDQMVTDGTLNANTYYVIQ